MSYITRVECLLGRAAEASGVVSALGASLTWSAAYRLAGALAYQFQMEAEEGPRFGISERLQRAEKRVSEMESLLAWAREYATNEEWLPSADEVVDGLGRDMPRAVQGLLSPEELAAEFEIDLELVVQANKLDAVRRKEANERLAAVAAANRESIRRKVAAGLAGHLSVEEGWDMDAALASRVMGKLADKLSDHGMRRLGRATSTLRPSRRASLATDFKLLHALCVEADELAVRWEADAEREAQDYAFRTDHPEDRAGENRLGASGDQDEVA